LVAAGSSSAATARTALSNRSIKPGKASRKKTRDPQGDIDPRPVHHRSRQDLETGDPAAGGFPDRAHAEQCERLAMSSPPVRMLAVPQADSARRAG